MDFVLAIWDPWDLGREWCDEARVPYGECPDIVEKRGASGQMLWWENGEAWKEEEGGLRREEGSGKKWERRRRQSSGDPHHDRKDEREKPLQCLW